VPNDHLPKWMKEERTRMLTNEDMMPNNDGKSVVYWMQRDVRTADNWALLFAAHLAETQKVPLHVIYLLPPPPPSSSSSNDDDGHPPSLVDLPMTERHGKFLLGGLERVHEELEKNNVSLHILKPLSHRLVESTIQSQIVEPLKPSVIVCDFTPIRHIRQWMECTMVKSLTKSEIPLWQVDAHNVVPVWHAAPVRQVGARTLRPKIHKVLQEYLQKFPKFTGNAHIIIMKDDKNSTNNLLPASSFDYDAHQRFLEWDDSVKHVSWAATPGTDGAKKQLETFITGGLSKYDQLRNNPNYADICSNMSPWLNHGHMSFQRCIMAVKKLNKHATGSASFIEEGLVRKELSDNYLYYTPDDYDSLDAAAGWARESLEKHSSDLREYLYTLEELEQGKTHDDLWNAAQLQVVREGHMHGFLRMYWAKKILEWTESPDTALRTAQYFNDKYALDGKDPNGFVGVGWSMMGIHDQGWKEREIFGKIRYMNYAGCKRKFKVADFVKKYEGAAGNAVQAEADHQAAKQGQKRKSAFKE
jgi:deoxyribodipyrimidine photo-lyase